MTWLRNKKTEMGQQQGEKTQEEKQASNCHENSELHVYTLYTWSSCIHVHTVPCAQKDLYFIHYAEPLDTPHVALLLCI